MIRVAINGFGRIGRVLTRVLTKREDIALVAINDPATLPTMTHLFKYDSVHGRFKGDVGHTENELLIDHHRIRFFNEKDPSQLPWNEYDIDVVIESSGYFKTTALASKHLRSGAKKVIISAPPADNEVKTVVLGINDNVLDGTERIISNASCTTNSVAPLIKVLDDLCGIDSAYITTVHSYTGDQRLHDTPHADLRRARAAALSIIPTTTGAAKAATKIFPHLDGRIGGCGIRVPVPDGSLTDLNCIVRKPLSIEEINRAFEHAAAGGLHGILEYSEEPLVSIDIVGNTHSCIFDAQLTSVIGNMVKVVGWYDNEVGYANRLAELIRHIA
jgi:glyceraldehyde 3-phosphate dehydrogenase